jgi:hypothetical protein
MPTEQRTRVEIFLPLRSDLAAYQIVTDWLAEEFAYTRGGSTLTTPFGGLYASGNQIDLVPDATRILYCDFDLDLNVPEKREELLHYLEDLRQEMMRLLEEEDVWIVYHPISRIVD